MSFRFAGLAAAVAAAMLAAMPAYAQKNYNDLTEPEVAELFCVYSSIGESDEYYDIGDVALSNIDVTGDYQDAVDMAKDHISSCADKYDWDDEQTDIATMMGIVGTASDVLMEDMLDTGFKDADLDAVLDTINGLDDDTLDALNDASYRKNTTIKDRLLAEVRKAGVQVDADDVDDVLLLMELNVMGFYASGDWVEYVFN